MRAEKTAKVAISSRIHPENYAWLKDTAAKMERSANWLLDKVITEARSAEKMNEAGDHANSH